jgi:flagellar biosynthesis/type III secretory pathway protein FliH
VSGRLKLEVFGAEPPPETMVIQAADLEEARLASFETGYTAGWDDAMAAQKEEQTAISADLARNLQTLSFTYHEARMHMLTALRPLFTTIVGKLLPELARESLAAVVVEQLTELGAGLAEAPVTIELHPSARPAVETLLDGRTAPPFHIVEEPTLGEGQVYLRLGQTETLIDLDRAAEELGAAVTGFFHSAEEKADG